MSVLGLDLRYNVGVILLTAASAGAYIAARALVDALAKRDAAPGRRAVAHWLPIALAAIAATSMRRPEIALGLLFATSVTALTLACGVVLALSPPAPIPAADRRLWPFVLPAALLTLLAGFGGNLAPLHALVLLIQGIVLVRVWQEPARQLNDNPADILSASAHAVLDYERRDAKILSVRPWRRAIGWRIAQTGLALTLGLLAGWAATRGAIHASHEVPMLSTGLVATLILGPAMVLSMIGAGTDLARRGESGAAITTAVGFVLLNLCLLVPLVLATWHLAPVAKAFMFRPRGGQDFAALLADVPPLSFPLAVWRIDTVVLVALGFLLVPMSIGHWKPGRAEGLMLLGAYCLYLMLVAAVGARAM